MPHRQQQHHGVRNGGLGLMSTRGSVQRERLDSISNAQDLRHTYSKHQAALEGGHTQHAGHRLHNSHDELESTLRGGARAGQHVRLPLQQGNGVVQFLSAKQYNGHATAPANALAVNTREIEEMKPISRAARNTGSGNAGVSYNTWQQTDAFNSSQANYSNIAVGLGKRQSDSFITGISPRSAASVDAKYRSDVGMVVARPNKHRSCKRQFLKGAQNAVDLLAIFPFYIGLIIDFSTSDGVSSNFENIRRFVQILRIIRIVRIFKLARHSTGLQVLAYTVKESSEELGLLVLLLLMGMTLFSTLIYYAEQNVPGTKFKSIIEGFWWAIITMTTIGYGDIYPDTTYGKMIGCMCCISGILFIALPIPTIVGNFSKYYREHRNKEKMDMNKTNAVDVADEFYPYFVIALDRARRISSYSARRSTIAKPITMQQKTEHLDTIIA
eukprot:gene16673-18365_t